MESLGPLVLPPNPSYRASSVSFLLHVPDHSGLSSPNPVHFLSPFLLFLLFLFLFLISFHLTPPNKQVDCSPVSFRLCRTRWLCRLCKEESSVNSLSSFTWTASHCLAIDRQEPVSDQIDEYLQLANPALPTRIFNSQQPTAHNQHAYRDRTRRTNKPSRF